MPKMRGWLYPTGGVPAVVTPVQQQVVWSMGALIRLRTGGSTARRLAILDHAGACDSIPVHRHEADKETIVVLDGELRVEVDGQVSTAGPGAVAYLPPKLARSFVVTSPQARFLTLHIPAGVDDLTIVAESPARAPFTAGPPVGQPTDPAALAAMAASHGIEILGPPLTP